MSYTSSLTSYLIEKTGWKFIETWDFSEEYFLAYCETTHLENPMRFYALFCESSHMIVPDDIGDKLSGKKKGMENELHGFYCQKEKMGCFKDMELS